ncbi:YoaK family protein [Anaerosacchariphilus polymeriproducens]|nr:YoaK family protein [Anaerosacchariphilus polymeriproducens]
MKTVTRRMKKRQVSDTLGIGMLLALAGGFLDIYSYLARGKVFANAQTGNMVLLGVNIAERNMKGAFYYLIPICAFVIGIILSQIIKDRFKENQQIHWRQITVAIEAVVLFVVMFIPQGYFNMIANVCISFVCSMQVQSFRKVHGNVYATTMCTGNLRSATEQLCSYRITKDRKNLKKSLQYYLIILIFIVGAIVGAFFTEILDEKAVGLVSLILIVVFLLMFYKQEN